MIALIRPSVSLLRMTLLMGLLALTSPSWAASADRRLPLSIEADRKHTDYKNGLAIYEGRVILTQGQLRLSADKATLRLRDGQLERAMFEGQPVTYEDRDDTGLMIKAVARKMDYQVQDETLTLTGQARIERAGDTLASERIVYHLKSEVVDAGAGGQDRVRMTLTPRRQVEEPRP